MSSLSCAMYGLASTKLSPDEKAFFRDCEPWGVSLFARNIETPGQVYALTQSIRDGLGRDVPIFIDQEGGRVQRLRSPHWREAPSAGQFTDLWERDHELALEAVKLNHQLLAHEMYQLGIDGNYAPCLDLSVPDAHDIIGDRAFHQHAEPISLMGKAALDGLNDQGVMGVIKHMPGHGRALADSHLELPVVDLDEETLSQTDFAAFKGLNTALIGMTAHIVYSTIDPEDCATFSSDIIGRVIRQTIGFDGLLMTDDLSMKALSGHFRSRCERALRAGCDILLHCNGDMAEMIEIAHAASGLNPDSLRRSQAALSSRAQPNAFDPKLGLAQLSQLLGDANARLERAN